MIALALSGLLGSFHCMGMCGGFVLALDRPGRERGRRILAQGLFHLGKASTYLVLGGLAGLAGALLVRSPFFGAAQAFLAVAAGVLMVWAGLQIAGLVRTPSAGLLFGPGSAYARALRAVVNLRGAAAPYATGTLAGLLPCPLVYAFLAYAVQTGSVLEAMGTMGLLGLCAAPALALVAVAGAVMAPHLRVRMVRAGGLVVVLLGLITVARGLFPDLHHVHLVA